jgi:membrane protein DedA with SNARE-associated domain
MDVELLALITRYGYAATFVGTLLEGETCLVLSGVAASRGYLSAPLVVVAGAAGAMVTDNVFFVIGRVFGPALLERFPSLAGSVARAHALVDRFPNTSVIGVRFLYGMRTVGPLVIGAGRMTWPRFALLDFIATSTWSLSWIVIGYVLGEAVHQLLGGIASIWRWSFIGVAIGGAIGALVFYLRRRKAPGTSASKNI